MAPVLFDAEVRYCIKDADDGRHDIEGILCAGVYTVSGKKSRKVSCTISTMDTRADALALYEALVSLPEDEKLQMFVEKYCKTNKSNIDNN